jgi:hypothetical protein
VLAALALAPAAAAGSWLPHGTDATWTYKWTDSTYATEPTTEKVTVKSAKGTAFTLAWTTLEQGNSDDAVASVGTVAFRETNNGLVNTDWNSSAPPPDFPILCAQAASCGNALSSTYYNVIWGARQPVLQEPLMRGLSWTSTGGASGDVSSTSTYVGTERITIPAFDGPVVAAKVRTNITQGGALGDPYGSGIRTTWWVYGVGPVKVLFEHAGGANAPVTNAVLQSTNLTPEAPPTDVDYFPLTKGTTLKYRWTNSKHLKKPVIEKFTVDTVVNNTARFKVAHVSGPIKVSGSYGFSKRLDGVINLWGTTSSATLQKFPPLGPRTAAPAKRNHFVTPFDLMSFGLNPILPAYPAARDSWQAVKRGTDFATYGVTGQSIVVGVQKVKVPAGTFTALVIRSTLAQRGFPYGSGTRTSWFAPGKGLVKLVFAHGDKSVSTVELVK